MGVDIFALIEYPLYMMKDGRDDFSAEDFSMVAASPLYRLAIFGADNYNAITDIIAVYADTTADAVARARAWETLSRAWDGEMIVDILCTLD